VKTEHIAVKSTTASKTFSDEERAAMQDRALELKANKTDGEKILLAKIAAMPEPDKSIANKIHSIIKETAPQLTPKTWYGMPAYANKDGKVVCFFQSAAKFKYRYATLGFNDPANLDEGHFWPTSYAITKLTVTEEKKIKELIKKAMRFKL